MNSIQDKRRLDSHAESSRYNGVDWLRGVAILFIISVHLSVGTTPSWTRIAMLGSQTSVAIFAAISGFLLVLLLDRTQNKSAWYLVSHRAKRLLPTYLKWTVVYLIALPFLDWSFGIPHGYLANFGLRFLAKAFLRGAAEIHLWFIPCLFIASVVLVVMDRGGGGGMPLRSGWTYLFFGAVIALVGTNIGTNFANHDTRLFGWTMLGMGFSRIVRRLGDSPVSHPCAQMHCHCVDPCADRTFVGFRLPAFGGLRRCRVIAAGFLRPVHSRLTNRLVPVADKPCRVLFPSASIPNIVCCDTDMASRAAGYVLLAWSVDSGVAPISVPDGVIRLPSQASNIRGNCKTFVKVDGTKPVPPKMQVSRNICAGMGGPRFVAVSHRNWFLRGNCKTFDL